MGHASEERSGGEYFDDSYLPFDRELDVVARNVVCHGA